MPNINGGNNVVVVGSLSMDLVLRVPRLPSRGETIKGQSFATFAGGKGNNQVLAAARAGASAAMIGKVGKDAYGDILIETLKANNVSTIGMLQDPAEITGIANIWVADNGDNTIIIVPNANSALTPSEVGGSGLVQKAAVVLLQLEINLDTAVSAAKLARASGAVTILNPAPALANLPAALLENIDIIIPNETEAELLTGLKPDTTDNAIASAHKLMKMGPKTVILTLGDRGALVLQEDQEPAFIEALKVKVVDTTAAGDAFCGAFAASLASENNLLRAARLGCIAGSLACTKDGAVPSLPSRREMLAYENQPSAQGAI
jgi:ribokinase